MNILVDADLAFPNSGCDSYAIFRETHLRLLYVVHDIPGGQQVTTMPYLAFQVPRVSSDY